MGVLDAPGKLDRVTILVGQRPRGTECRKGERPDRVADAITNLLIVARVAVVAVEIRRSGLALVWHAVAIDV